MVHFPHSHTKVRAPRVRVPNKEPVIFNIENQLLAGVLQKLSLTGGLAQVTKCPDRAALAQINLNTVSGPVCGLIEFLRPEKRWGGYLLPFRFIALAEVDEARLKKTLHVMLENGLGE